MSVKIIAEAGTNHNGCLETALKLVDAAKKARADYIKFQIIKPDTLYVPFYWHNGTKIENKVYKRRKQETLTYREWEEVCVYSKKNGIGFSASVFDEEGVDFLVRINAPFIKLASSDLNNINLIEYISKVSLPLIISTGMAELDEIKASVELYLQKGTLENLFVLHCVSIYPCTLEKTQLFKIDILKENLSCNIGFSDHTMNCVAACSAVTKGVSFVEKHFTLDKTMDGFDHKYASDPNELKEYVESLKAIEASLIKNYNLTGEEITKTRARRGLYLKRAVRKGSLIKEDDVVAVRPKNRLNPSDFASLIGKQAIEDIKPFHAMVIENDKVLMDRDFDWRKAADYWENEMKEKKMI